MPLYQVARELGLSPNTYREIEYGSRKVTPSELATLSQLLDADGAWLAERTAMDVPKGRNFMGYETHKAFMAARKSEDE
jgi:transcriptional regulator with XRE-family HTH domain